MVTLGPGAAPLDPSSTRSCWRPLVGLRTRLRHQMLLTLRASGPARCQINPDHTPDDGSHAVDYARDAMENYAVPALRGLLRGLHRRRHWDARLGSEGLIGRHGRPGYAGVGSRWWVVFRSVDSASNASSALTASFSTAPSGMVGFRPRDVLDPSRRPSPGVVATPRAHRPSISQNAQRGSGSALPAPDEGMYPYYPAGRRQSRSRRLQPDDLRRAGSAQDHPPPQRSSPSWWASRWASPRGLFRRQAGHLDHLHRQPRAGLPGHLAVLLLVTPEIVAAGVPQYMSMVLFVLFPSSSSSCCSTRATIPRRPSEICWWPPCW